MTTKLWALALLITAAVSITIGAVAFRHNAPAQPVTPVATTGTLSGALWLTRNNASSDLLRGVTIYILPEKIAGGKLTPYLKQRLAESQANAEEAAKGDEVALLKMKAERATAQQAADNYAALVKKYEDEKWPAMIAVNKIDLDQSKSNLKMCDIRIAHREKQAAREKEGHINKQQAMQVLIDNTKGTVDALVTFDQFKKLDRSIIFPAELVAVATVESNVDGKYKLALPLGVYYICASLSSPVHTVEWMVPVGVIDGQATSRDLNNNNAYLINN